MEKNTTVHSQGYQAVWKGKIVVEIGVWEHMSQGASPQCKGSYLVHFLQREVAAASDVVDDARGALDRALNEGRRCGRLQKQTN